MGSADIHVLCFTLESGLPNLCRSVFADSTSFPLLKKTKLKQVLLSCVPMSVFILSPDEREKRVAAMDKILQRSSSKEIIGVMDEYVKKKKEYTEKKGSCEVMHKI